MADLVLRPMAPQDLAAVLALQAQGYPAALHDSASVRTRSPNSGSAAWRWRPT